MSHNIMIQGSMSGVGKSLVTAGLCRVLKEDGHKVAPFKSQNMALNSYITLDGLEMGRAQVLQAFAAGIEPDVAMNPILLKPNSDVGSQVIVGGEIVGNMSAAEYFTYKEKLIPSIMEAYEKLRRSYEYIILEGAGSPAEINLNSDDIVNMGMAKLVDAPVLLVGDIDRGGVFAQLIGTVMLLSEPERARIRGLIINKFRGDREILEPGIKMLEEKAGIPVLGVLPYMKLNLEDEDSLTERFKNHNASSDAGKVDIAVLRLPRISNFTDFDIFESVDKVNLRYVSSVSDFGKPDMVILPGSKNTMGDLKWLRENGLEKMIKSYADKHPVFGICGGFQMLGVSIEDPMAIEEGGHIEGLGLLPIKTVLRSSKKRLRSAGTFKKVSGIFSGLSGLECGGYEIHVGESEYVEDGNEIISIKDSGNISRDEGCQRGNVYGTYLHGIFDDAKIAHTVLSSLGKPKGIQIDSGEIHSYGEIREREFSRLSTAVRSCIDMDEIYKILG
ncbi:MAG: cobyric acid synthase [Lachnospiraceae bacterium]|nr:cobyric acid synthase [Lachnospiraceae bacterium]